VIPTRNCANVSLDRAKRPGASNSRPLTQNTRLVPRDQSSATARVTITLDGSPGTQPEPPAGTVIRVYRHTPADHFTIAPNALARGRLPVPLRALARCLPIHLLSLPAGWEITRPLPELSGTHGMSHTPGWRERHGSVLLAPTIV
jgi:hypothetical protein